MRHVFALLLAFGLCSLVSCSEGGEESNARGRVSTSSDGVTVTAEVSSLAVTVVERLDLTLEIFHDPDLVVELPEIEESLGGFTVRDKYERPRTLREGRAVRVIGVTLEPFLPGHYELPELSVAVRRGDLIEQLPITPPPITVTSVIEGQPENASIGEPLGIVEEEATPPSRLPTLAIAGSGLVALVAIGIAVWRLMRKPSARSNPDPVFTGLARLGEISRELSQGGVAPRTAVVEAGAILRAGIGARLEPLAPSMTGEELESSARIRASLSAPVFDTLARACEQLDASSYAPKTDPKAAAQLVNDIAQVLSNLPARPDAFLGGPERIIPHKELVAT